MNIGKVIGLAIKTGVGAPMREVSQVEAIEGAGLAGDVPPKPHRGVTLLASGHWSQVCRELSAELPWHIRRANVLIDCHELGGLIGRTIRLGEVELEILGETKPCGMMDDQHAGLRAALVPDCRAGVHGRILRAGTIRVGDNVMALDGFRAGEAVALPARA
ncbi:MAG: MOSC domain-containing protein [Phycisphaerales bacterium]|nr:MOSC domain-containing protein [Phycisphaerales bacterium]